MVTSGRSCGCRSREMLATVQLSRVCVAFEMNHPRSSLELLECMWGLNFCRARHSPPLGLSGGSAVGKLYEVSRTSVHPCDLSALLSLPCRFRRPSSDYVKQCNADLQSACCMVRLVICCSSQRSLFCSRSNARQVCWATLRLLSPESRPPTRQRCLKSEARLV